MQLLISSPWWFILLCLAAGALYTLLLYRGKWQSVWNKILSVFRFIVVSTLCFLLLSPLLVQHISTVQKPVILMVMDNSQSIPACKDSAFYKGPFLAQWRSAGEQLGEDYDVQYLTTGSAVNPSDSIFFNEKRSNLGQVFDYVNNTFARQNVGAVVLASDGIYNRGNNPLYKQLDNHVNLFTIGMGDSTVKKDIILREMNVNAIAYMGNEFPIEIQLAANACQNQSSTLTVSIDGKTILTQPVAIDKNDFYKTVSLSTLAEQAGTKHITATLSTVDGEVSKVNNRKDVFIDVIDGREKILMVYHGPHPDIGAIQSAIRVNSNYEIDVVPAAEVKVGDIARYSVVILHQLPSRTYSVKDLLSACRQSKVPVWCITGSQSAIEQLQTVSPVARISNHQGRMNESQAAFNNSFNSFTLEDQAKQSIGSFPPLKVPYGNYAAAEHAEILAYQKIGAVNTKLPLWALINENGEKTALLFGEGFWRWRMADYAAHENHLVSNELVSKTIQYLATKEDKRKFRVYPSRNVYEEDEAVKFIAELYNNNYELVNQVDVKIELKDREGKAFKYTFSPYNKSYQLNIGTMPAGIYRYKATAGGLPDVITGQVLITPLQTELVNTTADFGLLRQMALKHGGTFEKPQNLQKTIDRIKSNTGITSTSYMEKKIEELINLKWLFFLLLALLAAEWLVRKYEGAY